MKNPSPQGTQLIHEKVKEQREKKNWTQTKLALAAKCSESVVERFEQGTRYPKIETIVRILIALDMHLDEWLALEIAKWRNDVEARIKDYGF